MFWHTIILALYLQVLWNMSCTAHVSAYICSKVYLHFLELLKLLLK
uniref:Uncharacterized protein n=1 Tax=Rhizophora mucronata TaxID=61149 RepID=A0A2P2N8H8_RHIMU